MESRILALDMGGTSVKAKFYDGKRSLGEEKWSHNYKDCGLRKARDDLLTKINKFCDCRIDAVGLAVAGLIATDNSLYRSTVLTSFQGFNLPEFLKEELGVKVVTIDNDADCGAISECENNGHKGRFLYVIVGSGIGSSFVNAMGELPYLKRFKPEHKFSDKDNPIPNDLGLQVPIPKSYVYQIFGEKIIEDERKKTINKVLLDEDGHRLKGPNNNTRTLRIGTLGSASSLSKILRIVALDLGVEEHYQRANECLPCNLRLDLDNLLDRTDLPEILHVFARNGDHDAKETFRFFGHFLGYGIAEAAKFVIEDQNIHCIPFHDELYVRINGPIMGSMELFEREFTKTILEREGRCSIRSCDLLTSNAHGACLRAYQALEQT